MPARSRPHLRAALAQADRSAHRLAPKVSVIVDGGGALSLDDIAADVRLRAGRATAGARFTSALRGDGTSAMSLGVVAPDARDRSCRASLDVIAPRGRDARAREVVAAEGLAPFARPAIAAASAMLPSPPHERQTRASRRRASACATARWPAASGSPSVMPMRPSLEAIDRAPRAVQGRAACARRPAARS